MPRARKKRSVQVEISRMVKRIVRQFAPDQIILFGSQARGDAGPDSDVDLLVVMPTDTVCFHAHQRSMRRAPPIRSRRIFTVHPGGTHYIEHSSWRRRT
jgi:predicted nucleotidyltransferase